jgi:Baculovirus E66 occlusion-derived virus envelope protein
MWIYLIIIVVVIVILLIVYMQLNNKGDNGDDEAANFYNYMYSLNETAGNHDASLNDTAGDYDGGSDLISFEVHYLSTLQEKFLQKTEKIPNTNRQFSDNASIFVDLQPWNSATDFGILLHTLIAYGVRFRTGDDALYLDEDLAWHLYSAMYTIYSHLPMPAPSQSIPWGRDRTDWYHFTITMPECFMNTCIVLRDYYDISELTDSLLYYYLPLPTLSMGWWRKAENAMRMCLPYAYGQLLRGRTFREIGAETQVQFVLDLIKFPLAKTGNGIRYDYAHFDRTDVRCYEYLVNGYFTFSYYNHMFGPDTVNTDNVRKSLSLIGSDHGIANPALLSRNLSQVLSHFFTFESGVFSGDFSKILTVRNDRYFGSIVGHSPNIVYYEANTNSSLHAPLWAMTRRIWSRSGRVPQYRNVGLESGVLLTTTNLAGIVNVPATSSSSCFYPTLAQTAVCGTNHAGAMAMHVRFEELNIEFHSYTLYHRYGMFHIYDKIKTLRPITNNARCVVLTRDIQQESKWTSSSNFITANGVTAKHHNIINNNYALSNFEVRTFDTYNMQTAEQVISAEFVNRGTGVACYSLLSHDAAANDNTTVARVPDTNIIVVGTNSNSVQCVFDFPVMVLKDSESRQVTVNDATNVSHTLHQLSVDKITRALSLVGLKVDDLIVPNDITRLPNKNTFYYKNDHGNQFKFLF